MTTLNDKSQLCTCAMHCPSSAYHEKACSCQVHCDCWCHERDQQELLEIADKLTDLEKVRIPSLALKDSIKRRAGSRSGANSFGNTGTPETTFTTDLPISLPYCP